MAWYSLYFGEGGRGAAKKIHSTVALGWIPKVGAREEHRNGEEGKRSPGTL